MSARPAITPRPAQRAAWVTHYTRRTPLVRDIAGAHGGHSHVARPGHVVFMPRGGGIDVLDLGPGLVFGIPVDENGFALPEKKTT
jgi:hypothetical protein